MKPLMLIIGIGMLHSFSGLAQNPVRWNFSAEKLKSNQFKIHLTANIGSGYHIYSKMQLSGSVYMPTNVRFDANKDIVEVGSVKEEGSLERVIDESSDMSYLKYSDKVNFNSIIKIRDGVTKTTLSGYVEFQACSEDECFPPVKVKFSLLLSP
ncbi:MAG TPA: protein-disulfide reductase DsbD domain-containing protein [Chitinophagaceae bacterium]